MTAKKSIFIESKEHCYLFFISTYIVCLLFKKELNFASPIISILNAILIGVMTIKTDLPSEGSASHYEQFSFPLACVDK